MPQVHVTILNKTKDTIKVYSPNMAANGYFAMGPDLTFPFPDLTGGYIYVGQDKNLQVLPGDKPHSINVQRQSDGEIKTFEYDPNAVADIFVQVDEGWSFSIRKADYPFTWFAFLVTITIDDRQFNPIFGDPTKNPPITPGQLTQAVTTPVQQPGNPVVIDPGPPQVMKVSGPVDIQYNVVSSTGGSGVYRPLGLALKGAQDNNDKHGWDIFENVRIGPDTLTIRNNYTRKGNQKKMRFKYYVLVQRKSDGEIGIIDPEIENEYAT